ncbi:MAG TPA: GlsB/YeaQ/YmgE family stress response membrane protein [Clostridiaceae bacterium]|nr:GlsB/YeaQ/YmgE family stress response membrane protein [Clostridiaceae bacterium]
MGIIAWIIVGGLAGWIASKFTGNDARMGIGANILIGIGGAIIGGWVASLLDLAPVTGINIWSIIVAVVGAVILLAIINAMTGRKR